MMYIEMIDNHIKYSVREGNLMGTLREDTINTLLREGIQEIQILKYFKQLRDIEGRIKDYSGRWTQSNRLCDVHYTIKWEGYNA